MRSLGRLSNNNDSNTTSSTESTTAPKSEGAPTHYEQIGSGESREEVVVAASREKGGDDDDDDDAKLKQSSTRTKTSSRTVLSSDNPSSAGSDPLLRRKQAMLSDLKPLSASTLEPPQFCLKFSTVSDSSPLPPSSDAGRPESSELLSALSVKSQRLVTNENAPVGNHMTRHDTGDTQSETTGDVPNTMASPAGDAEVILRSKSIAQKRGGPESRRGQGHAGVGGDRSSSLIARMSAIGHKRSSSAPIKQMSDVTSLSREGDSFNVFTASGEEEASASQRNRKLVSYLFII